MSETSVQPRSSSMTAPTEMDVIMIGGGPAGLTALHWCSELGLTAILFDKNPELGGQLLHIYGPVSNFPGVPAANGREFCDAVLPTIVGGQRLSNTEVVAVDLAGRTIIDSNGVKYESRAIIIATGVR